MRGRREECTPSGHPPVLLSFTAQQDMKQGEERQVVVSPPLPRPPLSPLLTSPHVMWVTSSSCAARRDMQQAEERALAAVDELMQEKQQNREELTVVGDSGMRAEGGGGGEGGGSFLLWWVTMGGQGRGGGRGPHGCMLLLRPSSSPLPHPAKHLHMLSLPPTPPHSCGAVPPRRPRS